MNTLPRLPFELKIQLLISVLLYNYRVVSYRNTNNLKYYQINTYNILKSNTILLNDPVIDNYCDLLIHPSMDITRDTYCICNKFIIKRIKNIQKSLDVFLWF